MSAKSYQHEPSGVDAGEEPVLYNQLKYWLTPSSEGIPKLTVHSREKVFSTEEGTWMSMMKSSLDPGNPACRMEISRCSCSCLHKLFHVMKPEDAVPGLRPFIHQCKEFECLQHGPKNSDDLKQSSNKAPNARTKSQCKEIHANFLSAFAHSFRIKPTKTMLGKVYYVQPKNADDDYPLLCPNAVAFLLGCVEQFAFFYLTFLLRNEPKKGGGASEGKDSSCFLKNIKKKMANQLVLKLIFEMRSKYNRQGVERSGKQRIRDAPGFRWERAANPPPVPPNKGLFNFFLTMYKTSDPAISLNSFNVVYRDVRCLLQADIASKRLFVAQSGDCYRSHPSVLIHVKGKPSLHVKGSTVFEHQCDVHVFAAPHELIKAAYTKYVMSFGYSGTLSNAFHDRMDRKPGTNTFWYCGDDDCNNGIGSLLGEEYGEVVNQALRCNLIPSWFTADLISQSDRMLIMDASFMSTRTVVDGEYSEGTPNGCNMRRDIQVPFPKLDHRGIDLHNYLMNHGARILTAIFPLTEEGVFLLVWESSGRQGVESHSRCIYIPAGQYIVMPASMPKSILSSSFGGNVVMQVDIQVGTSTDCGRLFAASKQQYCAPPCDQGPSYYKGDDALSDSTSRVLLFNPLKEGLKSKKRKTQEKFSMDDNFLEALVETFLF